jgi:serine/threonine-protein kinase
LAGERERAEHALRDLQDRATRVYVPALALTYAHIGAGRLDDALQWLDRAFDERDVWVTWMPWNPLFAPLWPEPRMQDLLRRLQQRQGANA